MEVQLLNKTQTIEHQKEEIEDLKKQSFNDKETIK